MVRVTLRPPSDWTLVGSMIGGREHKAPSWNGMSSEEGGVGWSSSQPVTWQHNIMQNTHVILYSKIRWYELQFSGMTHLGCSVVSKSLQSNQNYNFVTQGYRGCLICHYMTIMNAQAKLLKRRSLCYKVHLTAAGWLAESFVGKFSMVKGFFSVSQTVQ